MGDQRVQTPSFLGATVLAMNRRMEHPAGLRCKTRARTRQYNGSPGRRIQYSVVLLISQLVSALCSVIERDILVEFFDATNGNSWKNKENWKSGDICTWHGIGCNPRKMVQSITLDRNNLNGSVPPSLWQLENLQHVNLRMNLLTSLSLTGLSDPQNEPHSPLETMVVSDNHLTDLRGIANAGTNLKDFNANKNQIDEPVLEELSLLVNLQTLYIAFNQIPGTIPTRIGRLSKLSGFYAFDNRLTGTIPTEIGLLDQVQILGLGNNLLTGTLPTEMEQMVNIRDLSLHHMRREGSTLAEKSAGLSGPLLTFGSIPYLSILFLDGNRLTGTIPFDFLRHNVHTDTPISVGLTNNQLTGTLPKPLERFEALSIDLVGNQITGIPDELCVKGGWMGGLVEQFQCDAILCAPGTYASLGRASGPEDPCLPCDSDAGSSWYGNTACVSSADGTPESGSSPDWVVLSELYTGTRGIHWVVRDGWEVFDGLAKGEESLSDLTRIGIDVCTGWFGVVCNESNQVIDLFLPANRLYGEVPGTLFMMAMLKTVDLSNNNVRLPNFLEISQAKRLNVLMASNVRIQSMEGIEQLTNLRELRIDGQMLEQTLPIELFRLTSLETLHLQHSKFNGSIPSEVGLLTSLLDLNIYGNLLSGQLPKAIGALTKLQALDLSENQFDGYLPDFSSWTDLKSIRIHQSEGVKNIGGPLPAFDTFPLLREVNLEFNALTGQLPERFLMGVSNKTTDITISLGFNQIEGAIPESLQVFHKLNLEVQGNKITR